MKFALPWRHHIGSALALSGFQTAVSALRKPEALTVKVSRLPSVAHPEFDVMNAFELKWIVHDSPK